jgi:glycerol-3-phosphate dehydrogenase
MNADPKGPAQGDPMPEHRDESFERLRRNGEFDVVVVGGGINGIGVFRELALQGLRVLLVERNDFCSGCSAAPSRMIHGGLRYLENGEFDLVRESLAERDALLRNAPHMVRPLPTAIPITSYFSGLMNGAAGFFGLSRRPATRGAVPVKIGLGLYDWVSRARRVLPRHRFLGRRTTFRTWPELTPRLKFAAVYHDAWISHPERLGIELVLDTERMAPESIALNYAEIGAAAGDGFTLTDNRTGTRHTVTARAVVNATGAWLDESLAALSGRNDPGERLVSGTKGSHVILDNPALHNALAGHMVFFDNADGRVCILFPYLGKVLAGATDIRVDKAERVRCEDGERDYILASVRRVFPKTEVSGEDVVFSYSGIRPLPRSDHDFTGRISRGHFVRRVEGTVPQFCMVGGKWTTFRAFAEQTTDTVLAELDLPRRRGTLDLPIGGGHEFSDDGAELIRRLQADFAISPARAAHLADAYGTRALDVISFCAGRADDVPLGAETEITAAEIVFLIRHEFALGLSDLILRRSALAITGRISTGLLDEIARVTADELGWDAARRDSEVAQFIDELENYYGVSREMLDRRTNDRNERTKPCA